jgi:hypothetical protein
MKRLRELTIVTPNKPGKLSQVLRALAQAKINITAMNSTSGYDLNMVRMVTSDAHATARILEKLGYAVTEAPVLGLVLPDKPGQFAKVAGLLGKAKINIDYTYSSAAPGVQEVLAILHPSDIDAAERVLKTAKLR